MKTIKAIIIDDERPARDEVKRLLADYPEFEIIAEAKNVDEAKELIELKQPDLIFLDKLPVHIKDEFGARESPLLSAGYIISIVTMPPSI